MNKWQASIKLEFLKDSEGKTLLSRNLHQGPLVVQKPFYPEKACHIYLLHPPGGIAGCDHLQVEALLKEDTKVLKYYLAYNNQKKPYVVVLNDTHLIF